MHRSNRCILIILGSFSANRGSFERYDPFKSAAPWDAFIFAVQQKQSDYLIAILRVCRGF